MSRYRWWRNALRRWICDDMRAEIIPLFDGMRRTGWAVYVAGRHVGSWPKLAHAKQRAEERFESLPSCALSMGCLCAGHARGNAADAPCDTSEVG